MAVEGLNKTLAFVLLCPRCFVTVCECVSYMLFVIFSVVAVDLLVVSVLPLMLLLLLFAPVLHASNPIHCRLFF